MRRPHHAAAGIGAEQRLRGWPRGVDLLQALAVAGIRTRGWPAGQRNGQVSLLRNLLLLVI